MKKILTAKLLRWPARDMAQTADGLRNDGKNTENALSFGQNTNLQMYSK